MTSIVFTSTVSENVKESNSVLKFRLKLDKDGFCSSGTSFPWSASVGVIETTFLPYMSSIVSALMDMYVLLSTVVKAG